MKDLNTGYIETLQVEMREVKEDIKQLKAEIIDLWKSKGMNATVDGSRNKLVL